ncbi:MAG: epsE [Panacagrimonas sp.]|nr:GspE/PulE family protein [Panacagrimonas sp.]MCC2656160.1 epsE [Panacagrimonas sp.]
MNPRRKLRLGELLVEQKLLTNEQLQQAVNIQKQRGGQLGWILVELDLLTEEQILRALSEQLLLPVIDLRQFQFESEAVRLLPEVQARRHKAIVLRNDGDALVVGMADPTDILAYDSMRSQLNRPIKLALVRESELQQAIDTVYRRTDEIITLAEQLGAEISQGQFDLTQIGTGADASAADDAPVVRLLHSMFEDASQVHASDIHIEPEENLLRVRQRIDGFLHEQIIDETRIASALVTRLKLMSGLDISEKRLPQDGRFNIKVKNTRLDVRLSTMPVQHGESIVMRLLDQSAGLLSLEESGMPEDILARFRRLIRRPNGMVLVTGPTGSGKTTTLYGALNEINVPEHKIITVEDPVEYRLPRINQVQIHTKIELSFSRVLRSALRQDPDIIMVGEMRDPETAEIGVRAAMTGHLVLSTLHTNDAISTINRLVDMGVAGYMVATALNAVLAQRLVRRICDSCAQPYSPTPGERAWLDMSSGRRVADAKLRHGAGCQYCNHTGYRGRVGIYELLEIDRGLADLLRRGEFREFDRVASKQTGFRTLTQCGVDYVLRGITTVAEVIRVTGLPDEDPAPLFGNAASTA